MALRAAAEDGPTVTAERVLGVAVPVGLAVLTWLALLLTIGFLARLNSLSVLNLVPLFFVVLLFWPVYLAAPWRDGVSERVRSWARGQTTEFAVAVAFGLLPLVPVVPDLLVSVLQLPYRGSGIFFGASLFYRQRFGPPAGRVLLNFAQVSIHLVWLYLLSKGTVGVARRLR